MDENKNNFIYEELSWGLKSTTESVRYEGYSTRSIYIPMRDGVRLAADVCLPAGLENGKRIPGMLYRTRYWRDVELREPQQQVNPLVQHFTSKGYAVVRVDVRGTGASFGCVVHEWQPQDTQDAYDLVEWMTAQTWSNGRVGGFGGSYAGTTAIFLAETGHPAATAAWGTCFEFDGFGDIVFPGGVPSSFVDAWGQYTTALDENMAVDDDGNPDPQVVGVKPVDEDHDRSLLQAALREHENNRHADELMEGLVYRDDGSKGGFSLQAMTVYPRLEKIIASHVPLDIWGSWMDANTPDTVIRFFVNNPHVRRGVISAWSHGGGKFCSPYAPVDVQHEMPFEVQLNEITRFMDECFQGESRGVPERGIFYYTLGEEKWKFTPEWPPANTRVQRWHLCPEGKLSPEKPDAAGSGSEYTVDFTASSGMQNRWWTEMAAGAVVYDDRAEADEKLLVFQSMPLECDIEITGYPVISMFVTSTEKDGAFFVYLEDVDKNGKVTYITEGILRALHRKISPDTPPYKQFGPYHSYMKKDGEWLIPGEPAELTFALIPTSVLLRKGHSIRIAIGGADTSTFKRIPQEGKPVIRVLHNPEYISWLDLPVKRREG